MINMFVTWLLSGLFLIFTSHILTGFEVPGYGTALLAALVISILNFLIRPLITLLTLPINILTLGLFSFVINAIILQMADGLLSKFTVDGWGTAILASLILTLIHVAANMLLPGKRNFLGK